MSANAFDALAFDAGATLLSVMGQSATYIGELGTLSTTVFVGQDLDWTGYDTRAVERRHYCVLDRAVVTAPKRGDLIELADGTTYELTDERPSSTVYLADFWALPR